MEKNDQCGVEWVVLGSLMQAGAETRITVGPEPRDVRSAGPGLSLAARETLATRAAAS